MPRGTLLTEVEVRNALNMHREGLPLARIARILGRSRNAVRRLLRDPENYHRKHGGGRQRAISQRDERAILRIASNSTLTAREIAAEAGVDTNVRNVQRLLQRTNHIQRRKLLRKPMLTAEHKKCREEFATSHLKWKKRWRNVIFTDEKRFCLDGPDGWSYYFHDLRKDPLLQNRRQMEGGGIMVWAGVGYKGKTNLHFINSKLNSQEYLNMVDSELQTSARRIAGENFTFQQDNASVHTARIVKQYFAEKQIPLLPWPARSPDLNIIENVWGHLSRLIYSGGRQFQNINDLKVAIQQAWDKIPRKYIKSLYKSLPRRMLEVVKNKGGATHY